MSITLTPSQYRDEVRKYPCRACHAIRQIQAHHCSGGSMNGRQVEKGEGRKVSHYLTIPLCPACHVGDRGIHNIGVDTWEKRFGLQAHFVDLMGKLLLHDVWTLAATDVSCRIRSSLSSSKCLPRADR